MPQLKIFVRFYIAHITCRYDSLFRIHTRLLLLLEEISFQNMVPVYHDNVETRKRHIHILSEGKENHLIEHCTSITVST